MALSYRWGEIKILTTLLSIEDRKCGFDPGELPRTCRDAVMVDRALNIPYLWIDAVRIVQGTETSWVWQNEVAEMCSIYEKAAVTIAGVDGKDSDAGLFKIDLSRQAAPFVVSPLNRSTATIFARKSPIDGPYGYSSRFKNEVDQSFGSLHTRGWTLQEMLLSTRVLWFTKSKLGFTCPISRASQCQPRLTKWNRSNRGRYGPYMNIHSMESEELSSSYWAYRWLNIVRDYTTRDLANKIDHLPALQGLMAALKKRTGEEIFAGLWSIDHIPFQLLWFSDPEGEPIDMGTNYAPS